MATEIDLLTVNLWGLPWPVARDRRVRKQRFAEHFERRAYDLVGIQELWWPWRRTLELGSLVLPRTSRDSGLALAARLPVRDEVRVQHFRRGGGFDRLKRKGVLSAGVETPAGEVLSVCVVHLQAGAGRRHASLRALQIDELLEQLASERRPVVLMGDFNFHAGSGEDRASADRLCAEGFADVALELTRDEPTYHSSSNPYVRGSRQAHRFDRVYLRSGREARLQPLEAEVVHPARPVSDHHPLRVRVRVSK